MASVEKRGGAYRITVSCGYDSNGKKIRESITFIPTGRTEKQIKKELDTFTHEFEEKVKNGKYLEGEKLTFAEFVQRWLSEYAIQNISETTLATYKEELKHKVNPALGHLKLSKITAMHLQSFYNELIKEGYAVSSVKRYHGIISGIFTRAYKWNMITESPCGRVELPKAKEKETVKNFTPEQTGIFLQALDLNYTYTIKGHNRIDDTGKEYSVQPYTESKPIPLQMKVFFNMAIFGGFRRGELIALNWNDIDFESRTVSITKATGKAGNKIVTKPPKTLSSIREVVMPPVVINLLKQWRKEQRQLIMELGSKWEGSRTPEDNFIFVQWNGRQMDLSTPSHTFKKIIQKYNTQVEDESEWLPEIRLHDCRHTCATLLISQNTDIVTVAKRLGHSNTSTTLNIYSHALAEKDEQAADTLENLLVRKA